MGTSYKHAMVEDRIYGTPEDIPLKKIRLWQKFKIEQEKKNLKHNR